MSRQKFFLMVVIFISIIGILPILSMIFDTFVQQDGFGVSDYIKFFQTPNLLKSLQNSFLVALGVSSSTTFVGLILGIILGKTDLILKKIFIYTLIIPLLLPPYILAFGWFQLLGREDILFGFWGTSFILFSVYLPISTLLTIFFISQIDPKLEEAGLLMTGWSGVLKNITIPLIYPSIIISFLLVFILSFGEISVANFLRFNLISLESFIQFSAFYDFKMATISAMPLVLVTLIIVLIEQFLIKKNIFKFNSSSKIRYIPLEEYHNITIFFISIFLIIITIMPLSTIFIKASNISNFIVALDKSSSAIMRTLIYASIGATVLMIFGFLSGYIIENRVFKWWRLWDISIIFLFGLSSTVIGISLILFYNTSYTDFIYSTPIIIILGYLIKYLALTTKIVQTRLSQIPHQLTQSAQMVGAKWYQILYFITVPLSKKILILSWIIGFIFCIRENTITMLVYPAGSETLPIYIITQMANGKPEIISALCVIMILITITPIIVFEIYNKIRSRKHND